MEENKKVIINIDIEGIDENIEKAKRLVELLKEAKTLADELASVNFNIKL